MWFIFALFSALALSINRVFEKRLTRHLNYFNLGWTVKLAALPLLGLFWLVGGPVFIITNPVLFWVPLLIIWFVLYPIQTYAYYTALEEGELSEVIPILSFIPVFTLLISWFLIREVPTILGLTGIVLTVSGVYFVQLKSLRSFLSPFENRATALMVVNSLSNAVGSTLDKVALLASNARFYALINAFGAMMVLFLIAFLRKKVDFEQITINKTTFIGIGIFSALFYALYTIALTTGVTAYVLTVRNVSVLITAILGIYILHEKLTRRKIVGFICILSGIMLLGVI